MTLPLLELVDRLRYPTVWTEKGLYPEDLYQVQLAAFVAEAQTRDILPEEYRPIGGTEHFGMVPSVTGCSVTPVRIPFTP